MPLPTTVNRHFIHVQGVSRFPIILGVKVAYKLHLLMIELRRYQLEDESTPVTEWLRGLRDKRARAQIEVRLRRVSAGNFGDCKPVGEGVSELRVDIGLGYRVYYGKHGQAWVILLCGGDKASQPVDITRAKAYWADWKRRNS